MFRCLKREFFTSKARLNFEVYGQPIKITPEAGVLFWTIRIMDLPSQTYKKTAFTCHSCLQDDFNAMNCTPYETYIF